MPTYPEWNRALIVFATHGVPQGEYVFLPMDGEAIEAVGQTLQTPTPDDGWVSDFKLAVRSQCVSKGQIDLKRIKNPMRDGDTPRYVAFLAAMVLAAHYMGEDEDKGIHGTDYFTHLNIVFGLDPGTHRAGLESGEEEALWTDWQRWLRSQGFLSSLEKGAGKYKFISYPISQTLLRESDKDRLWKRFGEHRWSHHLDEDTVLIHLQQQSKYLNTHLQALLNPEDPRWPQRLDSLRRVCYEVYETWIESGAPVSEKRVGQHIARRVIRCGLLRQVDDFLGTREYFLYPKQPRGIELENARVIFQNETYVLMEDRPGWYAPLWQIDDSQLDGVQVEIEGAYSSIQRLELSPRDFWILTTDPEVPESGTFASWRPGPILGEPFVILCRSDLEPAVRRLRNEGFIGFEREPAAMWQGWLEFENAYIVSEPSAWQGIRIPETTLLEALRPRVTFKISLQGGLRVPGRTAWIAGHGPTLTVTAFYPEIHIQVIESETDNIVFQNADLETGSAILIPWDHPGDFVIRAVQGDLTEERVVRIVSWDSLQLAPPPQQLPGEIRHKLAFGALPQEA